MDCINGSVPKHLAIIRLHQRNTEPCAQALRCILGTADDSRDFNPFGPPNGFQMHTAHKACANNCGSNRFHQ
jgi:hypothetical protein